MSSRIAKTILVLLLLLMFSPGAAQAADESARVYVVGVPAQTDRETASILFKGVLKLLLKASAGDRVVVYDAAAMKKIADCAIGDGNERARVMRLRTEIAFLKTFFDAAGASEDATRNQVRAPQFLDLIAPTVSAAGNGARVVMFAAPCYEDARDPAFVFRGELYPSDGFVLANSRSSVFGTADKRDRLRGAVVHWAYLADTFGSELLRVRVRRFWGLFLSRMGAALATFETSPDIALDRALAGADAAISDDPINEQDVVMEMRSVTLTVKPPSAETPPTPAPAPKPAPPEKPAPTRVATPTVEPKAPDRIVLALTWIAEDPKARYIDLDLHVRTGADKDLCFRTPLSDDGRSRYVRDVRTAAPTIDEGQWSAAWEVVELDPATNLDQTACWVNVFSGGSSAVTCVVRVAVGEKVRTARLSFPALPGNRGAEPERRESDPNWRAVDLAPLLK